MMRYILRFANKAMFVDWQMSDTHNTAVIMRRPF